MSQSDVERAYRRRFAYCSFHRLLIEFNSLNDEGLDEDDPRMAAVNILLPYNSGREIKLYIKNAKVINT